MLPISFALSNVLVGQPVQMKDFGKVSQKILLKMKKMMILSGQLKGREFKPLYPQKTLLQKNNEKLVQDQRNSKKMKNVTAVMMDINQIIKKVNKFLVIPWYVKANNCLGAGQDIANIA